MSYTLYFRPGCPYCARVLEAAEELGVTFDMKNIHDQGIGEELIARGGKIQVPYFVDMEKGIEMYESDAIIAYIKEHAA